MTRQRDDNNSTEWGLWLRNSNPADRMKPLLWICPICQTVSVTGKCINECNPRRLRKNDIIASELGYQATNIDYMWYNKYTHNWFLMEEKRHLKLFLEPWQKKMFEVITHACKYGDPHFQGFHYLTFENTSPLDGRFILDYEQKIDPEFASEKELFSLLCSISETAT